MPPLQSPIVDANGLMNRAWSTFFRDIYRRIAYKGGNSIDANTDAINELILAIEENARNIAVNKESIEENALLIAENTENILINAEAIVQNALAISENTAQIALNIQAIISLAESLDIHVNAFEAHGSNGEIVGFNDLANESLAGLVKQMLLVSDAAESSVNIVTADLSAAPAIYDQAYMQLVADLTNENKAAVNQLSLDLNAAIAQLNELIANSKSSGQMKV